MKAILMREFGDPDVLYTGDVETPRPGPAEVLIKVAAAGVNRADLLQRMGRYPPPPGDSEILGLEVAGTVTACGENVDRWSPGDRVMTLVGGGGYAEYVVAPASTLMPVAADLDLVTAAAIPEVFTTTYLNLMLEGGLKQGETVLIHGGGSGIGTTAIQMATRLAEAIVIVTVGDDSKARRCLQLGARQAIVYKRESFAERVAEFTGGRGVDLILDHIGGQYLEPNLQSLAISGRLVVIGLMGGASATLDLAALLSRRLRVIGSVLRARPVVEKASLARALESRVLPLITDGALKPVIHQVLPLQQAAAAHRLVAANQNFGKIILQVTETT